MPRKHTKSAIIKSERTEEEKATAKAKARMIVNRRYRRKLLRKVPDYDRERKARSRADFTDEERAAQKDKKKEENAMGYLRHRENILAKQMQKRAGAYIEKHGESKFIDSYPHRDVKFRKYLQED
ncbi:hypothetical protein GGU10DRAFT_334093 [Lentinula aff. detonsa]|uniref:Uncharacterized protein n=1 Tax=Lentinula aff. detonsa TaxID=2804958 RepID=A0AA38NLH1_9AGAR|nr:hypothetical protein GGU10DRAFT_334093 [Lentinula aff. detonsa]